MQLIIRDLIYRSPLYKDFAPYSFLFKERYPDGRLGVVGGLVYHGTPDRSGCYCEPRIRGWEIHT